MKQQVLKALANPARIFYVPYSLAVLNFVVQFIVFVGFYLIAALVFKKNIEPLFFLVSVVTVHMIIAAFAKRDPQVGNIVAAKIQLMKRKIPGRLVA